MCCSFLHCFRGLVGLELILGWLRVGVGGVDSQARPGLQRLLPVFRIPTKKLVLLIFQILKYRVLSATLLYTYTSGSIYIVSLFYYRVYAWTQRQLPNANQRRSAV